MMNLTPPALAVLRVMADADGPAPSLRVLASLAGLDTPSKALHALLLLSDRRLIDGYGSDRRLTDAGWETLATLDGGR